MKKVFPEIYQKENFEKEQHLNLWQLKNGVKNVSYTQRWETCGNFFRTDSLQVP